MAENYKKTLNLPKTEFPMKGNLTAMEPRILKYWEDIALDEKLSRNDSNRKTFILHDGPPYANGDIHVGHTLNKVLKDIIVKFKHMTGYYSPYVPGWDCHGQPIEHEVEKRLSSRAATISQAELRELCRDYALKFVERQKQQFIRLGVTGEWDKPYLTLDHTYEATNVRVFNELYQKGLIYKGKKPIHWCWSCRTALAEAEIEYADEPSPSIYLKFPLVSDFNLLSGYSQPKSLLVWTTTPWTLPANVAVAVKPEARYVAARYKNELLIVAEALLEFLREKLNSPLEVVTEFAGREISGQVVSHPIFADKTSQVVTAEYVALDQGTGSVHIAPGHGADDFAVGSINSLPTPMPVDDSGIFTKEAGKYEGEHILKANNQIVDDLKENGIIIFAEEIDHSYPHCWRCKKPVIFRATKQWFISMANKQLRQRALSAIKSVRWTPAWSINRINAMVTDRPDWCISRQRAWGVPIPVFYCDDCDELIASRDVLNYVEDVFMTAGADSWFKKSVDELLPPKTFCPKCGGHNFRTEKDILDVWFESGVSHEAVLKTRDELAWPADLYLEGSDQHRGWFQSSLLTSVGLEDKAPYKQVLTHGFLVDGVGRKMSKSLGNVIDPLKVIKRSGADILRLWVSSSDYHSDIAVSDEILKRITETYRRVRNTLRFISGNLQDFNLDKNRVSYSDMTGIDKWALMRLQQLIAKTRYSYEEYKFYLAYHALYNFCNIDLSSFYLDVLKDRLYTFAPDSKERRSAQTVLAYILKDLIKLLAPILVFTSEEAWQLLPDQLKDSESVHLSMMPVSKPEFCDLELEQDWDRLLELRSEVSKAIEVARNSGVVNGSLEVAALLYLPETLSEIVNDYLLDMSSILIVSQVEIGKGTPPEDLWQSENIPGLVVDIKHAKGEKCQRCWNWRLDVGRDPRYPEACGRCADVINKK